MLGTSTHDTKRSEDVRARLALLAEIPEGWEEAVERWAVMNEHHRAGSVPSRNDEYLLYQTLVGAWPVNRERTSAFMKKAVREAKLHTSWTDPDERYEEGLDRFIGRILGDVRFRSDLEAFVRPLIGPGRINSLSQVLVKLTAPGVPDIYQGTELWDLSLVDPDNRRPVDFEKRRALIREAEKAARRLEEEPAEDGWVRGAAASLGDPDDGGASKLWVVRQTLRLRRDRPFLFGPGSSYRPLRATGTRAGHVFGFVRGGEGGDRRKKGLTGAPDETPGEGAVTLIPLHPLRLQRRWEDSVVELPRGRWRGLLDGRNRAGSVPVGDLFDSFPVSLLVRV
jgi:(1->4)-alpha-D-glucan 1-alpha-D-glucosylmutase